jgi:hypothetical protein
VERASAFASDASDVVFDQILPAIPIEGALFSGLASFSKFAATLPVIRGFATKGGAEALQVGRFRLTQTVAGRAGELVTRGPFKGELARPFINSPITIEQIIATGRGVPDPGGVVGALRFDAPGAFRGVQGTFELVIKDDLILHFNFVR